MRTASSAHRRPHHRPPPRVSRQLVIIAALVVATLAAGGWYLLGRGDGDGTGNDYVSVEKRFATAAWAVHFTPLVVQQFGELHDFNNALDAQALVMEQSIAEFDRIAHSEDGAAADIARSSIKTGQDALRAVSAFRDAIVTTNNLAAAQDALDRMDRAARELDAKRKEWKQL